MKIPYISLFSFLAFVPLFSAQTTEELQQKIEQLQLELERAQRELAVAKLDESKAAALQQALLPEQTESVSKGIRFGDLRVGGAIRAGYAIGDYASTTGPSRGSDGGNFALDTFRVNLDYSKNALSGKFEYRWYNGYNMLHTAWIGYQVDQDSKALIGVNRVPFGVGPYGVSNSWFFDQHYYVGLADDMDLGVRYTTKKGDWTWDVAYYVGDEGSWRGASRDSARYSYDPVVWKSDFDGDGVAEDSGYTEKNQVNLRGIVTLGSEKSPTDLGFSLQYSQLDGVNAEDGDAYAASIHVKTQIQKYGIKAQLSHYEYNIGSDNGWNSGDLIPMGAFDFAWPVAAKGTIPAIAVNRLIQTDDIEWLDSVNVYAEYSTLLKNGKTTDGVSFKDSDMFILGAAWASGGWYVYTDFAFSNGNYFVGLDEFTTFGANLSAKWQSRFNINFGYYF